MVRADVSSEQTNNLILVVDKLRCACNSENQRQNALRRIRWIRMPGGGGTKRAKAADLDRFFNVEVAVEDVHP